MLRGVWRFFYEHIHVLTDLIDRSFQRALDSRRDGFEWLGEELMGKDQLALAHH